MKKLIPFVLVGMIVLIGCVGELTHGDNEASDVATANEEDAGNFESSNRDDLSEYDEIIGMVESIGNGQFEISVSISEIIEIDGEEIEVGGFDPDADTVVVVDADTIFEMVESDGMNELDRWEGSFDDLFVDGSVMVLGQDRGDDFLARQVIIWVWR